MKTHRARIAPFLVGGLLIAMARATAQLPDTLLHSFFDGGSLGWSVAMDGSTVVASASGSRSVKVFDAPTGALLHTLTDTRLADTGFAGSSKSVAISGSHVVVGAFLDSMGAQLAGSAVVYDFASDAPTTPVVLTNPSPKAYAQFGFTVAISGTRVAVGAPYDNTGAVSAGVAYIYDLASATPVLPVLTLTNPSPAGSEAFGNGIALCGSRLVIGGYRDNNAYVYHLDSPTPEVPVLTLTNPTPAPDADRFGSSVGISGTRVVVGAYLDDTGSREGTVYVFDLASATPTMPVLTLTNPSPTIGYFGSSLSISGTRLALGSSLAHSVYVYELAGTTPTVPVAILANPSPDAEDSFGNSVAIDGETVAVGAPWDDTQRINAGAVYVFGPSPALRIVRAAPGFANISWTPATSSGFVLQFSDGQTPTNWVNAPSGATNPVTVQTANGLRFYRLFQP